MISRFFLPLHLLSDPVRTPEACPGVDKRYAIPMNGNSPQPGTIFEGLDALIVDRFAPRLSLWSSEK